MNNIDNIIEYLNGTMSNVLEMEFLARLLRENTNELIFYNHNS